MRTLARYHFGGILADDMGLGKTLQMIAVLLAAKLEGKTGTSLIVTPASLVFNWGEEFKKFAPELKVTLAAGTQAERQKRLEESVHSDVLITSYDLLKRDAALYEGREFLYQVLDEAQYIKNHTTAAAKAVKVIKSRFRFALTGTPIENRLSELWSIFDYLMPGFLYGYDTFRREFEIPVVKNNDQEAMERDLMIHAPIDEVVMHYAETAKNAGLDGIVCSPLEAGKVHERCGKEFLTVTPGVRFADGDVGDQKRVMTPAAAKAIAKKLVEAKNPVLHAGGGILLAHEVGKALGTRAIFTEREKGVMTLRRGFHIEPGERVLIVEDIVTTGGSVQEVVNVVKKAGGVIIGVGLLDRSGGKAEFGVPKDKVQALLHLTVPTYKPEECPLCKQGIPMTERGSHHLK